MDRNVVRAAPPPQKKKHENYLNNKGESVLIRDLASTFVSTSFMTVPKTELFDQVECEESILLF